jgi:hypothetical protein
VIAGQFREVDLDLLADYVGGALTGTGEQDAVERMIRTDPAWKRAHTDLVRAVAAVHADLAIWGAAAEPMPADVFDRLTAAIEAAPGPTGEPAAGEIAPSEIAPSELAAGPSVAAQSAGPPSTGSGPIDGVRPTGPARPTGAGRPSAGPGRRRPAGSRKHRRPRWARLAVPGAVAAAVVTAVGLGIVGLLPIPNQANDNAATYQESGDVGQATDAADGAGPPAIAGPAAMHVVATGTDYLPATLAELTARLGEEVTREQRPMSTREALNAGPDSDDGENADSDGATLAGLRRLTDETALTGCLASITAEHARGPIVVEVVDYATFAAQPALVLVFVDNAGQGVRWAWAVGADCGLPGSGADTRYRIQVG